jgi:hypothetical protein
MKNSNYFTFLFALLAWPVFAAPVHIEVDTGRTQEHGAGISVGKGAECFVVTPLHVVEFARTIIVTDSKGRSAKAIRYQAPDGVDAALLKVETGHTLECPEDWDDGSSGQAAIHEADFLISRKVKQRGMQQRRFFLGGESSTTLSLQPFSSTEADRLVEGDSGSSLYAENRLIGMIVSVDTASGSGSAIKQSQLHALFGGLVLKQSVERALINPVYYRNTENRYATSGVRDFIDARTPFEAVTLDAPTAAANLQNQRRGNAPVYPDNLDYIVSTSIIESRARNEQNPNYKASAAKESNVGKKLLNSIGGRSARYLYVSNIDVEVQILKPKENRQMTHIARLEYKVALTDSVDKQELRTELPVRAAVDALHATMLKYDLPVAVAPEEEKEDTSLLGRLFKKKE